MKLRDPILEYPQNYQVCFILPHYRKAEYIDGFWISGNKAFINVKYWLPIKEISDQFEY